MTLGLPFLLAFLVSAALVPIIRAVAFRLGYITVRSDESEAGAKAKARFGGAAIPLTLLACSLALDAFAAVPVLLACSAGLFIFGFASDLFTSKASTRAVALVAVASVFLFFDHRLYWAESVTVDSIVTVLCET